MNIWTEIKSSAQRRLFLGTSFLVISALIATAPISAQEVQNAQEQGAEASEGSEAKKKGFFGRILEDRRRRKEERRANIAETKRKAEQAKIDDETFSEKSRTELIDELRDAKKELTKREFRIEQELAEAKEELRRRQESGQITPEQTRLTPANIRDKQLSELEQLKAELARRRATKTTKEERIGRALSDNELAYRYIDQCITRPDGNFQDLFSSQSELELVVAEKKNQVYRNADRTVLIQTTPQTCDVSFSGGDIGDYTAGLVHILETQGGLVETKRVAGLTIVHTVHPRGNYRLATGRKVIGNSNTNFYTSIIALQ